MVHPLNRLNRLRRNDDGVVAIIVVLLTSIVFVALSALVVDLGMARDTRRQAQNAADASTLAAGNALYLTGTADINAAISAAKLYATKNYGISAADWAGCTDASALAYHPDSACISFDNSTAPTMVRVKVPTRQVQTPFAGIWGVHSVPVGAAAGIQIIPGGLANCGLCVIGSGPHDLQVGNISVSGANVAFNRTLDAKNSNGGITVSSGYNIDLQQSSLPKGTYNPAAPVLNQAVVIDPLAGLIMPNYSSLVAKSNSCTDGPGIYASLASTSCTMLPGLYVLTGPSHLSGQTDIVANGVTLFFICGTPTAPKACTPGESDGGDLLFTGKGSLDITAPTTGPTQGMSIIADRNSAATFDFRGNADQLNSGTIYALNGTLNYRGNGATYGLDSLVVVGDITFNGQNSAFNSSYTKSANTTILPSGLHLSQ
jgi:Flp pilus assembly protein TadG